MWGRIDYTVGALLEIALIVNATGYAQTPISPERAKGLKPPVLKPDTAKCRLAGKAKFFGDSVVLRWSASDPVLWQLANQTGYTIDPYELILGELANRVTLATQLKPWPLAEWKRRCRPQDTTAALAAQMLYGISKDIPKQSTGSLSAVFNQRYDAENRFFIANMVACWSPFHASGLALRCFALSSRFQYGYGPISRVYRQV